FTSPDDGQVTSHSVPVTLHFSFDSGDGLRNNSATTITLNGQPASGTLTLSNTSGTLELGVLPSAVHTAVIYVRNIDDREASDTLTFRVETAEVEGPAIDSAEALWNSAYVA